MKDSNATAEIVQALKYTPLTYSEMARAGMRMGGIVSMSPHKRVQEWLTTAEGAKWQLRKSKRWLGGSRYLTEWRIVRKRK